jgi:hypothetical protein
VEPKLKYRGRVVTSADVTFIRALIAEHPRASRRALSLLLCEAWNWVQPNGSPRDMVCRGLMLALHRADEIELPAPRWVQSNPSKRLKPAAVEIDRSEVHVPLADLRPLEFRLVRRTEEEPLFNGLIDTHHYLGYTPPVGEHLKYLVYAHERPVACLSWSSAPRHLGPRDRFIGWSAEARKRNIGLVVYNSRFLILPWVEVPHLASHILGRMARELSRDWQRIYGHPVYFLETFVDPARFRGTCYRAANWVFLGRTTGRGHQDRTNKANRPEKDVLGYPLCKRFRELLCRGN